MSTWHLRSSQISVYSLASMVLIINSLVLILSVFFKLPSTDSNGLIMPSVRWFSRTD